MAVMTAKQPPRRGSLLRQERLAAYVLLSPNLLGFVIFFLGPLLYSLYLSFCRWDILRTPHWIGLGNYQSLFFDDPLFIKTLINTAYFVVLSVPPRTVLALAMALAVNQGLRGTGFYRSAFYMPSITSIVAIGLVWRWVLNPEFGIVNAGLRALGLANPPEWLLSTRWAMPGIAIMTVWLRAGYFMVIFLAGLQAIPEHLYDAAKVDGANAWQRFWHVTLPLLAPTTFFVMVISIIGTFQVFEASLVMTNGGPADSTMTIVLYLFRMGFQFFKMGYASAIAWVLCAVVFVLTYLQMRLGGFAESSVL